MSAESGNHLLQAVGSSAIVRLCLLTMILPLAACAGDQAVRRTPAAPAPTAAAEPAAPVTAPPAAPKPAAGTHTANLGQAPPAGAPLPRPAPEPFPMQLDPGILIGLAPEQAELMMGRPTEVRDEPPATVWAYKSGDCTLEVFFYQEVETRQPRALAYHVEGKDQSDTAKQACFSRIRMARRERQG
jgi:hypothetical protein